MNDVIARQFDLTPPNKDELRALVADLSEDERHVLLEHGTEASFCGVLLEEKRGSARRSFALVAAHTRGMSFPTGRRQLASDTASIPSRSNSRRMANHSRTNSVGVLPRARYGRADDTWTRKWSASAGSITMPKQIGQLR